MFSFKTFRAQISQVLYLQESPHRTAMAFAIGVFIAFSPTYGLHTLSAVFCAWAFRLNFIAVLVGALINNPWTIAPILVGTFWTGFFLMGMPETGTFHWDYVTAESLKTTVLPYLFPFVIGACFLSAVGALLAYPLARLLLAHYKKLNHQ